MENTSIENNQTEAKTAGGLCLWGAEEWKTQKRALDTDET